MTSKVFIRELSVFALVGVYPTEREAPQPLTMDLEFTVDWLEAAKTDCLEKTLDYAALCTWIENTVAKTSYQLLEALAYHLACSLLTQFDIQEVFIRILKPNILTKAKAVGVELSLSREEIGLKTIGKGKNGCPST